jgi:hypothetical protein
LSSSRHRSPPSRARLNQSAADVTLLGELRTCTLFYQIGSLLTSLLFYLAGVIADHRKSLATNNSAALTHSRSGSEEHAPIIGKGKAPLAVDDGKRKVRCRARLSRSRSLASWYLLTRLNLVTPVIPLCSLKMRVVAQLSAHPSKVPANLIGICFNCFA